MNRSRLMLLGVVIMVVGFAVVVTGSLYGPGGSGSSGGFILIGPIPIIFGSGPESGALASIALVITGAMIVLYLLSFLFWRSERRREEVGERQSE